MKKEMKYGLNIQYFAEDNLNKTKDFAKEHSIDHIAQFTDDLRKLYEILGITNITPVSQGVAVKTYKSTGKLEDGKVAEGELIPLSKVKTEIDETHIIEFSKHRRAVSMEAIQMHGRDQAIANADAWLIRQKQKALRSDLIGALSKGTNTVQGEGLQGALAQSWGAVQTVFEDSGATTIAFANPKAVADYLGSADITIQSVFGLQYIQDFVGATVFLNSEVPVDKIYATAPQNLNLAYVPVASGSEIAGLFGFTSDETGFMGMTHQPQIDHTTIDTVAVSGVKIYPERTDGVVVATIKPKAQISPETLSIDPKAFAEAFANVKTEEAEETKADKK